MKNIARQKEEDAESSWDLEFISKEPIFAVPLNWSDLLSVLIILGSHVVLVENPAEMK